MCRFILFLVLVCISKGNAATIVITQTLTAQSIDYFRPFDGFPNVNIPIRLRPDGHGDVHIDFSAQTPTIIKLIIGEAVIWLVVEQDDVIKIHKAPKVGTEPLGGVFIEGSNSAAHIFYNKIYNYNPVDKFQGVRDIFETNDLSSITQLTEQLERELMRQTRWIDSLQQSESITTGYAEYMRVEISSILGWEIGNLCDTYYSRERIRPEQLGAIRNWLFKHVNPLDTRIYSCGVAPAYYYTYYQAKAVQEKVDPSQVIIPEEQLYASAPAEMMKGMWGRELWGYKTYAPTQYDYERLYNNYKLKYRDGDYIKYFDSTHFFKVDKGELRYRVINSPDQDIFGFMTHNFGHKRILIDIWATWCAPCKAEFTAYNNKSMQEFLREHGIELFFLSIDKETDLQKWKREVSMLGLPGSHALAGKQLLESIKDVIFDGGSMVIPRHVLVNERGQIVDADLLSPNHSGFRNRIEKAFSR